MCTWQRFSKRNCSTACTGMFYEEFNILNHLGYTTFNIRVVIAGLILQFWDLWLKIEQSNRIVTQYKQISCDFVIKLLTVSHVTNVTFKMSLDGTLSWHLPGLWYRKLQWQLVHPCSTLVLNCDIVPGPLCPKSQTLLSCRLGTLSELEMQLKQNSRQLLTCLCLVQLPVIIYIPLPFLLDFKYHILEMKHYTYFQ